MSFPPFPRLVVLIGLTAGLLSGSVFTPALAQSTENSRSEFPGRRVGGGTRGDCDLNSSALVALTPASHLGVSSRDRQAVYFLVPVLEQSYPVEFLVQDTAGQAVYETSFEVSPDERIAAVQLPANTLQVGQDYNWHFVGLCDAEDWTQNVVLTGWLRRVMTAPTARPDQTLAIDEQISLARVDQAAGRWGDAIATITELYQRYPEHEAVQTEWIQLLQDLDLATGVAE